MLTILTRQMDEKELGTSVPDGFYLLVIGELVFFDLPALIALALMLEGLFNG